MRKALLADDDVVLEEVDRTYMKLLKAQTFRSGNVLLCYEPRAGDAPPSM